MVDTGWGEDFEVSSGGRFSVFSGLLGLFRRFLVDRYKRDYVWTKGRRRGVAGAVLHAHEAAVGAEILPVKSGFIAVQELECVGIIGEGAKGKGGSRFLLNCGVAVFGGVLFDFTVHERLLHDGHAHSPPAGGNHVVDEGVFERGLGLEFVAERLGESVEFGVGFGLEENRFGEGSVAGGVLSGGVLAGARGRSAGFGVVDTGSLELLFGSHGNGVSTNERAAGEIRGGFVDFKGNRGLLRA